MILKFLLFAFLLISLQLQNTFFEIAKEKLNIQPKYFCIRGMVNNFGLKGNLIAKKVRKTLEMCPKIKFSCCTYEDQLKIYENWIINKEYDNVKGRLTFYSRLYKEILKIASEVNDHALTIIQLHKFKRQSNCKVLAKKIQSFDVRKVIQKLLIELKSYEKFFLNTYKGLYCTMCDARSHRYIDLIQKKLIYSKRFCRDMIKSNFFIQSYYNVHLLKFLNISMNFLNQCNYKGVYKEKELDNSMILKVDFEKQKNLKLCRNNRNIASQWFQACKPICENFKIDKFQPYYAPNIQNLGRVIEYCRIKLYRIKKDTELYLAEVPIIKHPFKLFRILEEKKEIKQTNHNDTPAILKIKLPFWRKLSIYLQVYSMNQIFKSGINPITDISKFSSTFQTPIIDDYRIKPPYGLNLMKRGLETNINEAVFKQIKESLRQRELQNVQKIKNNQAFSTSSIIDIIFFLLILITNQFLKLYIDVFIEVKYFKRQKQT